MTEKVKFKDKMKKFGSKTRNSIKKRPKLFGGIAAVIILASGGSATGLLEAAAVLNQVSETVEVIQAVTE